MAFIRKVASNHASQEISSLKPSILQAIRCISSSKLFVGGLPYGTNDKRLKEAFSKYGQVVEARVVMDRHTGKSRGFAYVTYSSADEAAAAAQDLDQQELYGCRISVNYANSRVRGYGPGSFRGGNSGGGGGYGGSSYSNPRDDQS